jgi:hypothetical protein
MSVETEDDSYLFSLATEFFSAAEVLVEQPSTTASTDIVAYYLLGHAAELFLKCYLVRKGVASSTLKDKYGHSLLKLIEAATENGLPKTLCLTNMKKLAGPYQNKLLEYRKAQCFELPFIDDLFVDVKELYSKVFDETFEFTGNS